MFHLSVKPISRAAGRSATAAAAYRSGQLIADARTGEVHDYTRKSDVVHSEILVPPGAPAWAEDRTALWNAAEAAEKRKDARVARDYEVAIPKELTREEGIELVRDFAQGLADRYGVAVDFNVHRDELRNWDGSEKGWQGYHAHVLTSTRKLGRAGFGDKAAIELSDAKRKSLGLSDGAGEIDKIRQLWEVAANRHLEQANQAQRIDRRSLKDQGIDRDPTVHLGPHVTALERDGIPSRLGDLNRQVIAEGRLRAEHRRTLLDLDSEIEMLEPEAARSAAVKPVTAKRERPSRAQQPKELDFSGLAAFAAEQDAWRKQQAEAERETAPERKPAPQPIAARSIGLAAELERQIRARDERVRRVLDRALERQARREEMLRRVVAKAPEPPAGLLATFQRKSHQQALAAWDSAKVAAWRLAQQAKQLAQRIRELARPERVRVWAEDLLKQTWPAAGEVAVRGAEIKPTSVAKAADRQSAPDRSLPETVQKFEQSWKRVKTLIDKAMTESLSLPEKREVARGWDGLAKLVNEGHRNASPEERRSINAARLHAHRQVAAAVFLAMPPGDVVREFPQLAGALRILQAIDEKAQSDGLTLAQRKQVEDLSRQRIAVAIEKGESLQVRFKEQGAQRQIRPDRDRER